MYINHQVYFLLNFKRPTKKVLVQREEPESVIRSRRNVFTKIDCLVKHEAINTVRFF